MNNKRIQRMLPELDVRQSGLVILIVGTAAILAYLLLWPYVSDSMPWLSDTAAIVG